MIFLLIYDLLLQFKCNLSAKNIKERILTLSEICDIL